VPLIAMAEVRASRFMTGTTHARPAVTLVSALPPVRLGKGIEAETYAAAGYVGAASTPFIDGQMRVEQVVSRRERPICAWAWGLGAARKWRQPAGCGANLAPLVVWRARARGWRWIGACGWRAMPSPPLALR
jgi:hypothetical protein